MSEQEHTKSGGDGPADPGEGGAVGRWNEKDSATFAIQALTTAILAGGHSSVKMKKLFYLIGTLAVSEPISRQAAAMIIAMQVKEIGNVKLG